MLVTTATGRAAEDIAGQLGVGQAFRVERRLGAAALPGTGATLTPGLPVFAMAGIARPERFFDDLRRAGWTVAGTRTFRDHHRFDASDVAALGAAARACGAEAIVTTEKDAVRLEGLDLSVMPIAAVPLAMTIEPADRFAEWLLARLALARSAGCDASDGRPRTPPGPEVRR